MSSWPYLIKSDLEGKTGAKISFGEILSAISRSKRKGFLRLVLGVTKIFYRPQQLRSSGSVPQIRQGLSRPQEDIPPPAEYLTRGEMRSPDGPKGARWPEGEKSLTPRHHGHHARPRARGRWRSLPCRPWNTMAVMGPSAASRLRRRARIRARPCLSGNHSEWPRGMGHDSLFIIHYSLRYLLFPSARNTAPGQVSGGR